MKPPKHFSEESNKARQSFIFGGQLGMLSVEIPSATEIVSPSFSLQWREGGDIRGFASIVQRRYLWNCDFVIGIHFYVAGEVVIFPASNSSNSFFNKLAVF